MPSKAIDSDGTIRFEKQHVRPERGVAGFKQADDGLKVVVVDPKAPPAPERVKRISGKRGDDE